MSSHKVGWPKHCDFTGWQKSVSEHIIPPLFVSRNFCNENDFLLIIYMLIYNMHIQYLYIYYIHIILIHNTYNTYMYIIWYTYVLKINGITKICMKPSKNHLKSHYHIFAVHDFIFLFMQKLLCRRIYTYYVYQDLFLQYVFLLTHTSRPPRN